MRAEEKNNAWRHERIHQGTQVRPRAVLSVNDRHDRYALGVDIVIRSKTGDVRGGVRPIGAMRDEIACAVICAPGSRGLWACIAQAFRALCSSGDVALRRTAPFTRDLVLSCPRGRIWTPGIPRSGGPKGWRTTRTASQRITGRLQGEVSQPRRRRPGAVCLQMTWSKCAVAKNGRVRG